MSGIDQLRKNAEAARELAAKSQNEADRALWLGIAKDWEFLAVLAENQIKRGDSQDSENSN